MARTVQKYQRIYVDGYDLSGDASETGELVWTYDAPSEAAMNWEVKGCLPGQATHGIGPINAFMRTTSTTLGIHDIFPAKQGGFVQVMSPIGFGAAPAMGDPVYVGRYAMPAYTGALGTNLLTTSLQLGQSYPGLWSAYSKPWGVLAHAAGNETAVNAGTGIDQGASTSYGGWMAWQVFGYTGTGSVTLTIQDSADGSTGWTNVTGATTGAIAHTAMPQGGLVFLATNQTVRRHIRWQLSFSTLTGCNFALAFGRCVEPNL